MRAGGPLENAGFSTRSIAVGENITTIGLREEEQLVPPTEEPTPYYKERRQRRQDPISSSSDERRAVAWLETMILSQTQPQQQQEKEKEEDSGATRTGMGSSNNNGDDNNDHKRREYYPQDCFRSGTSHGKLIQGYEKTVQEYKNGRHANSEELVNQATVQFLQQTHQELQAMDHANDNYAIAVEFFVPRSP